jgi:malate dehydrogenase (oxaloacetate-decarboxylating)
MDWSKRELSRLTNKDGKRGGLSSALAGADVFIGVSGPGVADKEMIRGMNGGAVVVALANPVPEIMPDEAKAAGARVVGTGRSDFKNQINNVLAFPGVFRGALDARAKRITKEMKLAAARALSELVSDGELTEDYIIPSPFDARVAGSVAKAVFDAAKADGVND